MAMVSKRKHNALPVEAKLEIIRRLENGESRSTISRVYNIGRATITGILSKKEELLEFVSRLDDRSVKRRKSMKNAHDKKLDDAVFLWYKERKSNGEHITGPVLCEMALQLNKQLGGSPDFKASSGWLHNFKSRHCIRGRENDCDILSMEPCALKLKLHVDLIDYRRDNVYAVIEISVNWKSLAQAVSLSSDDAVSNENDLVVLACSNTSGKHKLPLLIIGGSSCPLVGQNFDQFTYVSQNKPVLDIKNFSEWYTNKFLTAVKARQEMEGKACKTVLLLDNEQCLSYVDILNSIDENFKILFTTLSNGSVLQPMNEEIVEEINNNNKQNLNRLIVSSLSDRFVKSLAENIDDAVCAIVDVWNNLPDESIKTSWDKLWKPQDEGLQAEVTDQGEVYDILDTLCLTINHSQSNENKMDDKSNEIQDDELLEFDSQSVVIDDQCKNGNEDGMIETVTGKRRNTYLPIETKLEIIGRLEKGESRISLSRVYNIGRTTILDIWSKKEALLKFASSIDNTSLKRRKTLRTADDIKLDEAVYSWFVEKKRFGELITGPILCQKALEINEQLGGSSDFKASSGWLKNFRVRHGISGHSKNLEDKIIGYTSQLDAFKTKLLDLGYGNYCNENIFFINEFIVNCKSLFDNSSSFSRESASQDVTMDDNEVVVLTCSNVSGTLKLPLFIVLGPETPEVLEFDSVFITHSATNVPILDEKIFSDWCSNRFIPFVKSNRKNDEQCVLLLHDSVHLSLIETLNKIDNDFKVLFLSKDLINSDQLKKKEVNEIMRVHKNEIIHWVRHVNVKREHDSGETAESFVFKSALISLSDAWNTVSKDAINSAWEKLWGNPCKIEEISSNLDYKKCSVENSELLSDDSCVPSNSEAFSAFKTIIGWYKQQAELAVDELAVLNRLKDLAESKLCSKKD